MDVKDNPCIHKYIPQDKEGVSRLPPFHCKYCGENSYFSTVEEEYRYNREFMKRLVRAVFR